MRRRWREWSKAGTLSNGSGVPSLAAAAGEPSYQDLVSSFQILCTAAADQLVPGELDVSDLVKDASMLSDAVNISKNSVIEWMEMQDELLTKEPKQSDFVFRVKQNTHSGRQV